MNYSVHNLTQVSDCNALLTWAAREKSDLNFKKLSDERLTVRFAETSQELDAILQGVLAELAATETIIAVLPEGPSKDEAINKKTRLEYKKFLLENRKESYGTVALLEKEMDLARVEQEIEEVDAFIAAIEEKKAALTA
ncbi:hypothetical protein [Flavobacterium sangjuense]|uniref:Uncharacterized protein n=1 Tax=Flavobacterium sangjuense TaxID=2518177 RepID=A0A4P7PWM8_9FLAO|nr:hypothetical protein [Flavobacterium sangjuense]QBZ98850.1 hypothetical protein GS03_02361 [Flavobacterium sangjuense]